MESDGGDTQFSDKENADKLKDPCLNHLNVEDILLLEDARNSERTRKKEEMQQNRMLGLLNDTRVECQNLLVSLQDLEKQFHSLDGKSFSPERISIHLKIYDSNKKQISCLIKKMRLLLDENSTIHQQIGDNITYIENTWQWFTEMYPNFEKSPDNVQEMMSRCNSCIEYLKDIIYRCSYLTIPSRTNEHLESVRVGYSLDFYKNFKDELCSEEQSKKILEYLADHPRFVDGIVDVEKGVIYKTDPPNKRKLSYYKIIGAVMVGLIFSILALTFNNIGFTDIANIINSGTLKYMGSIAFFYIIFITGATAHIIIDALKETQSPDNRPLKTVEEWALWIHIKETAIIKGIVIVCIGFIGLMIMIPAQMNTVTVFIGGYSIDSLGDLFIQRFEMTMTAKGEALKKSIFT